MPRQADLPQRAVPRSGPRLKRKNERMPSPRPLARLSPQRKVGLPEVGPSTAGGQGQRREGHGSKATVKNRLIGLLHNS